MDPASSSRGSSGRARSGPGPQQAPPQSPSHRAPPTVRLSSGNKYSSAAKAKRQKLAQAREVGDDSNDPADGKGPAMSSSSPTRATKRSAQQGDSPGVLGQKGMPPSPLQPPAHAAQASVEARRTGNKSPSPRKHRPLKSVIIGSPHRSPRTPLKSPSDFADLFSSSSQGTSHLSDEDQGEAGTQAESSHVPASPSRATLHGRMLSAGVRRKAVPMQQRGRVSPAADDPYSDEDERRSRVSPPLSQRTELDAAAPSHTRGSSSSRTYGAYRSFLLDASRPEDKTFGLHSSIKDAVDMSLNDSVGGEHQVPRPNTPQLTSSDAGAPQVGPAAAGMLADLETHDGKLRKKDTFKDMLSKWGSGDLEADSLAFMELKTASSLRSSGELRLFEDELDYIMTSMDPAASLSSRQAACLEAVCRLCPTPDDSLAGSDELTGDRFLHCLRLTGHTRSLLRRFCACGAGAPLHDETYDATGFLDATLALFFARLTSLQVGMSQVVLEAAGHDALEHLSRLIAVRPARDPLIADLGPRQATRRAFINNVSRLRRAAGECALSTSTATKRRCDNISTTALALISADRLVPLLSTEGFMSILTTGSQEDATDSDRSARLDALLASFRQESRKVELACFIRLFATMCERASNLSAPVMQALGHHLSSLSTQVRTAYTSAHEDENLPLLMQLTRLCLLLAHGDSSFAKQLLTSQHFLHCLTEHALPGAEPTGGSDSLADDLRCISLGLLVNLFDHGRIDTPSRDAIESTRLVPRLCEAFEQLTLRLPDSEPGKDASIELACVAVTLGLLYGDRGQLSHAALLEARQASLTTIISDLQAGEQGDGGSQQRSQDSGSMDDMSRRLARVLETLTLKPTV